MLLKVMGAVIIIAGGACLGICYGKRWELRSLDLMELKRAFNLMYLETEFGHTFLAPMCKKAAKLCTSGVSDIFSSFAEELKRRDSEDISAMWRDSVIKGSKNSRLEREDIEFISNLGENLGSDDIKAQLSGISLAIDYIDKKTEELSRLNSRNFRLYKNAGTLFGIFIAILLF